ncbi:hypothetical protein [Streptomyces sp. NPDC055085]
MKGDTRKYVRLLAGLKHRRVAIEGWCEGSDFWNKLWNWCSDHGADAFPGLSLTTVLQETGDESLGGLQRELAALEGRDPTQGHLPLSAELWELVEEYFPVDPFEIEAVPARAGVWKGYGRAKKAWLYKRQSSQPTLDQPDFAEGWSEIVVPCQDQTRYVNEESTSLSPQRKPIFTHVQQVRQGLWRGYHTEDRAWKFIRHAHSDPPEDDASGWHAPLPRKGVTTHFGITGWRVRSTSQGTLEYSYSDSADLTSASDGNAEHEWIPESLFKKQAEEPLPVPDAPPGWWVKIVDDREWVIKASETPSAGAEVFGWLPAEEAIKRIRNEESILIDLFSDIIRIYPELENVTPEIFEVEIRKKFGT